MCETSLLQTGVTEGASENILLPSRLGKPSTAQVGTGLKDAAFSLAKAQWVDQGPQTPKPLSRRLVLVVVPL